MLVNNDLSKTSSQEHHIIIIQRSYVFPKDLISCLLVRSLNDYEAIRVKALASTKKQ